MKIFKLIIVTTLALILAEVGYCQAQKISTANTEDYSVVFETLKAIGQEKGDISFNSLNKLMNQMNRHLDLRLQINYEKEEYLVIKLKNKTKVKFSEYLYVPANDKMEKAKIKRDLPLFYFEVEELCLFLKPLIEKKLNDFNFQCDYLEFLSDYLLTIAMLDDACLYSRSFVISNINKKGMMLSQVLRKDSSGSFLVKYVFENSTEEQLGLMPGDEILAIQRIPTRYLGGGAARSLFQDVLNRDVEISLNRNGQVLGKTLLKIGTTIDVDRDSLALIERDILYIHLKPLKKGISNKVKEYLEGRDSIRSIILDLQHCQGGDLKEICDLVGLFINAGDTVCTIKYSNPLSKGKREFLSTPSSPLTGKKIIVLISGQTASGAELIARALQFYSQVEVVGMRSLGFGDLDVSYNLGLGKYVCRMKVGELYGAGRKKISDNGIEPDFHLERSVNPVQFAIDRIRKK